MSTRLNRLTLIVTTVAVLGALVTSCGGAPQAPTSAPAAPTPSSTVPVPKTDVVAVNVDSTVKPGDDFFAYANGTWLKAHPIPASESSWGIGELVDEDLYAKLRATSEGAAAAKGATTGSDDQKVGDFWTTAIDEGLADRVGVKPLQSDLDLIEGTKDLAGILDAAFVLQHENLNPFFGFGVGQDEKASDVMAVYLTQGGLGLPDRDYYFNKEAGVAKVRQAYVIHLANVLKLLAGNTQSADARAQAVMAFETSLAKVSRPLAALRDPRKNYNKMTPAQLTHQFTPSITWSERLNAWKLAPTYVIVGQPEFFTGLHSLLGKTPLSVLRDYLRLQLLDAYSPYLGKAYAEEHYAFYKHVLSGQEEQQPRWKRVIIAENHALGMILGRIYVNKYFPEAAKQRYSALVEAMRTSYGERMERLTWMSDATKAKAQQKLAKITKKVGFPDHWKDYSALLIARNSFAENVKSAQVWQFNDAVSKFGKPVDRTEWDMTPQTYNAYYNPSNNEIVLPAAMFTIPGFMDAQVDDAVVYGYAAASTIGHEMTHGFDDEGRQFDGTGNLLDWWTKMDGAQFKSRAAVLAKQFDAYEPLPGLHINGNASLGENIADFGGLLIGLDAFKKTQQYKDGKSIAGYTPVQRYFLGYALSWLFEQREEGLRKSLLSDVHAPPKWRVNGPLSNIPEFYEAFGVQPGQALYRPDAQRAHIW